MPERRVRVAKRAAWRGVMVVCMLRPVGRGGGGGGGGGGGRGVAWGRCEAPAVRGVGVAAEAGPGRPVRGGKPDQVRGGCRLLDQLPQELLLAADAADVRGRPAPGAGGGAGPGGR